MQSISVDYKHLKSEWEVSALGFINMFLILAAAQWKQMMWKQYTGESGG